MYIGSYLPSLVVEGDILNLTQERGQLPITTAILDDVISVS